MARSIRFCMMGHGSARARRSGFGSRTLAAALAVLSLSGCFSLKDLSHRTADAPETAWTAPPAASKSLPKPAPAQIPAALRESGRKWSLLDLVDVGLVNNPQTKAAWNSALASSAGVDIALALYFPNVSLGGEGTKTRGSAIGGRFTFNYSSLDLNASLNYLLLDFGGRAAGVQAARQALYAANWTQNSVIQSVILLIEQNYYSYLSSEALVAADQTSLKEAEAGLDAADTRHRAGVATIADVLQARAAVAQARLNLISDQGAAQTFHGALASSIGLPAETPLELADELPSSLPLDVISEGVEKYIADAQASRPDLAAARAKVLEAQANIRSVRSAGLPTITGIGSYDRIYYKGIPNPANNYALSLSLSIPVTGGIANRYRVLQAEAEAKIAQAQMEQTAQGVILQVWRSYFSLKTAAERIQTALSLLATAEQSYKVSTESYRRGVQDILELLAAQNTLESARVQLVQARTDWLLSLAQFAHDTGALGKPDKTPAWPLPVPPKKGDRVP